MTYGPESRAAGLKGGGAKISPPAGKKSWARGNSLFDFSSTTLTVSQRIEHLFYLYILLLILFASCVIIYRPHNRQDVEAF